MKNFFNAAASTAVGGAVGAGVWGVVGNIGVAAMGTAVGVTAGPFIAIGGGLGLAGYGVYWLGKQIGGSADETTKKP